MAAIAYPQPQDHRRAPRPLRLVEPVRRPTPRRRPGAAAYRRRRLVALFLVVFVVLLARAAFGWLGGGPLTASEPTSLSPRLQASYVVQPGDTLWTIARQLQPQGDVRPLVTKLTAARQGAPLSTGERIALPAD